MYLYIARLTYEHSTVTLKVDESRAVPSIRRALIPSSEPHAERTIKELQLSCSLHSTGALAVTIVLTHRDIAAGAMTGVVESTTESYIPTVFLI